MAFVYEFLYRGRDPLHEPDKAPAWHVSIGGFPLGVDGKPAFSETGAITPARAAELGFTLDKILGEVAAAAVLDRDAALAAKVAAEGKIADAEAAKAAALDAAIVAGEYAASADKLRRAAEANLADAVNEAAAKIAEIQAGMEPAESEPEGPKNPALHWITGGLLGN